MSHQFPAGAANWSPVPKERAIRPLQDGTDLRAFGMYYPSLAVLPTYPLQGTTYGDMELVWKPDSDNGVYDSYVYYQMDDADRHDSFVRLWFCPASFASTNENDKRVLTWTEFGNHNWPTILRKLEIIGRENNNFSAVDFVPDVNEGTKFTYELYISVNKFNIRQTSTPQRRGVLADKYGTRVEFQECIGKEIKIPSTKAYSTSFSGGTSTIHSSLIRGQKYPATNFRVWQTYKLSDKQELKEGLWYRVAIYVTPPQPPKQISR